jgi:uncharacterized protein (TIGR00251 family)
MLNIQAHLAMDHTMSATKGAVRRIQVKVKPNARVSSLEEATSGGIWQAQLKSPPVDGRANEELVALVARHFACRKAAVSIKSGASGRVKLVQIEGF